jgi:hypothetical protein
MSDKIAEIASLFEQDNEAKWVSHLWDTFNRQRAGKIEEWKELRNYIFATDTSTTSNQTLGWKNKTTIPKICQIRDNLHSNYVSALFPNDSWLSWQAYSKESAARDKAQTIEAYMDNKTRMGGFRTEMSKLLYDYIDYGNAFCTVTYENRSKTLEDGTKVPGYVGPVAHRISPLDIVFNPLANKFEDSFKIVRSTKSLGEVKKMAENEPDNAFWADAISRREELRSRLGQYTIEDFDKAVGYSADGYGNMYEYYMSEFMEVLEFYGDYHNSLTGELETGKVITIVDRSFTVRNDPMPSWELHAPIYHVGWRFRQDNLWAMGPLDNLVGMQYRIDHLENLKADAMDLIVHPPLVIAGEVEEFDWHPGAEIHIDEGGTVTEASKSFNGILSANSDIKDLEDRMELYAGAPREAMGVRTPGEKTAFEVGQLSAAAGRIFQEKITQFEVELLEKALNQMLSNAARNLNTTDLIRVIDNDLGVERFKTITREDITAKGIVRPIGARHFAKEAQDLQNLIGIMNSPLGPKIMPHMSGLELTKFVEDVAGLDGYNIFQPNIAIEEETEMQSKMAQAQEDLATEASVPVNGLGA